MTLTQRHMDDLTELVREVTAREVMPRFRNLSDGDVMSKSHARDLVTVADRTAEDAIRHGAEKIFPGAAIVGEEAVAVNPALLEAIAGSELCIIVDPIDGTANYVDGLAVFGTILAVVHRGQTLFGLLYDPIVGDWMFALRGEGGWYHRGEGSPHRLHTKIDCELPSAIGFLALEDYDIRDRQVLLSGFEPVLSVRDIRCSCHEYRLLASGAVDFLRSYTLKPWDHAAGLLLLEETGGWAAVDGERPYAPTIHSGRIVAASCEAMGRRISNLAARLP